MRLVHFGTFDVENFGDLLFPLIARHRLAELEADITFASPVGGPAVWQDCVPTTAVTAVTAADAALLGGGNIVHAGPAGVDAYRADGLNSLLAYTRLWLLPGELARVRGIPLCWNAPGVPQAMTPRAAEVLRWAATPARYLSVRDAHSLRNLRHAGIDGLASVVPDPALDVAALWSVEELAEARAELFREARRTIPERTIAVHLNDRDLGEPAEAVAARLDQIATRSDAAVLLLALGPCHGDDALARRVGGLMRSDPVIVDRPRSLRQLVAAIAGAEAYLGSSLHGLITAVAFGRPGMLVAREPSGSGKFSGFLSQFQLGAWLVPDWAEAEQRVEALLGAEAEFARVVAAAAPLLDAHWSAIATALREPLRRVASAAAKATPSLDGVIGEGVEAILARSHRLASRLDGLEAEVVERGRRLDEAQRRVGERDAIVSRLSDAIEHARDERELAEDRLRDAEEAAGAKAELERAAADLDRAKAELESVGTELRRAREEAQSAALRADAAVSERDARTAELEQARGRLLAEEGRVAGLQARAESAEREAGEHRARSDAAGEEAAQLRARLLTEDGRVAGLQARLESAEREAGEQRAQAAAVEREAEEVRASLRDLMAQHEQSLERERVLRERSVRERDDLEERLESTLAALNEARLPARGSTEPEAIEAERDRLRSALLVEQAARAGLEEHVEALRTEIALHARDAGAVVQSHAPSAPVPPEPTPPADPEAAAAEEFSDRYDALCRSTGLAELDDRERALPWPVFPPPPDGTWQPRASIIVCVHNALEDLRRCLASVARHLAPDAEVVLVDDGSDEATARFLVSAAAGSPRVRLITNTEPPHGYTIAANLGLRAAAGDYLVLLNSDTIVTAGWLERVVACGDADDRVGIVGPVSNAASHQSVPKVRDQGAWATNPLPGWLTVEGMGVAVAGASASERPRVPFVNGYCYAIKRATLDAVGYLDEENFAEGYCEENDFSLRALEAGFTGAVADDAFVFHAKSRSYTPEGRNTHAKRNYKRFLEKHGVERVQPLVDQLEDFPPVFDLGRRLEEVLAGPAQVVRTVHERLGRPVEPVFVLPGIAQGGSGGSHSIVQEVSGLRALGVSARIAIGEKGLERALATYPEHTDVFMPFGGERDLHQLAGEANVLVATHSDSVPAVGRAAAEHPHVVPAYYVQDYEPFFWPEGSDFTTASAASYAGLPDGLLFAKTNWVCNLVSAAHGVVVHKVEPSLDTALYRPPEGSRGPSARVVVAAMVRLRTPRRQPRSTVRLLERLAQEHGDRVEIVTFGCRQEELEAVTELASLRDGHQGLISRAEVAALLQRADLFVDLSVYQAFGRTALEAMACGCVPVVPAAGGAWEFAEPDVNALVCDTRDPRAVHDVVTGVIEDADRRRDLAQAGLVTAAEYSIERAALSEFALFAGALLARDRLDQAERIAARAV